ncbi:PEP/pyruvate-binding domain-containing protein [Curtobacterium sp. MCBD17_019]|uniref:PEP/pyruvate-binding domain-containing protein n=1 Tax=Curtobacterium sp. MCBD17_019 TaxID=2175669 RepID=UPI000DA7495F|nr:PEP/pyruvate-binding domain-containing protein [Curtobacterium sp. MCBD17_019]PZE76204.1 phosphate kinase [Curtobacterium sp. MCBD17_019]
MSSPSEPCVEPRDRALDDAVFALDHHHGVPARELTELLGGKGAGLAEMTALGLAVPPGFTIALPVFRRWRHGGWPSSLDAVVAAHVAALGERMGRRLGDPDDPLLLSVRSGAAVSMPGMLDTVLDLGLNDDTVRGLARVTGDEAFAEDSHRRFLRMYATIVMGVSVEALADAEDARTLRRRITELAGRPVPHDPEQQLREAIAAVFASWDSERARAYRARDGIDDDAGTAVTVQAMVFGNRGPRSGTGVVFTRDPATGAPGPYGDYLVRGQGEDVVDGSAHPVPVRDLADLDPQVYVDLMAALRRLEAHYRHVCDVEFTIEEGRLWFLQTRAGKLSAVAAVRTAVDLVDDPEVALTPEEAVARVPEEVRERARRDLETGGAGSATEHGDDAHGAPAGGTLLVTGLGASPGIVTGAVVFSSEAALAADGDVVLVRRETSPKDVVGMSAAVAIVTCRGGLASHAAVVARGWGVPAVVGAGDLVLTGAGDDATGTGPSGVVVRVGDLVTVDGASGRVWVGSPDARDGAGAPVPPDRGGDRAAALRALERLDTWAAGR